MQHDVVGNNVLEKQLMLVVKAKTEANFRPSLYTLKLGYCYLLELSFNFLLSPCMNVNELNVIQKQPYLSVYVRYCA